MITKKVLKWKDMGHNFVLELKDCAISYNPCPNSMSLGWGSDTGGAETALIKNGNYLILNGDFRKNYEKCKNYTECLKFFNSKKAKYESSWSNK